MLLAEISDKVTSPTHALIGGLVVALMIALLGVLSRRWCLIWFVGLLVMVGLVGWIVTCEDVTLRCAVEAELRPRYYLNLRTNYFAPVLIAAFAAAVHKG
jgi:hypothetical protein